jgi:hypothetical protein
MRDVLQVRDSKGALQLVLLLLRALLPTYAQSSCSAGTADLDSDGVCHQCYSYVPPTRTGHGTIDISSTLANNAAGCVRTLCFVGAKADSIVITPETTVTTNMVASCSSEYGCYASCPATEMPRPTYTQSRTQCPLLPAVSGMAITLDGGLERGESAVYTCEPSGSSPTDGDASRTCQVDHTWSGVAPTQCSGCSGDSWDSDEPNSLGQHFTLCRLANTITLSGDGASAQSLYVSACNAAGFHPVGCGIGYNCASDWPAGDCVQMPDSFGCNPTSEIQAHTGFTLPFVTFQEDGVAEYLYTNANTGLVGEYYPVCGVVRTP